MPILLLASLLFLLAGGGSEESGVARGSTVAEFAGGVGPKGTHKEATGGGKRRPQVLSQSILLALGAQPIKRLAWSRDQSFSDEIMGRGQPVVLTGTSMELWAEQSWTAARLAQVCTGICTD